VRIPAHTCGVYAFKPTPQRFSLLGVTTAAMGLINSPSSATPIVPPSGQEAVRSSIGVLANDVESLALTTEVWLKSMHTIDPFVPPLPFNREQYTPKTAKPLRVGYLLDDGWFTPSAACSRAVQETVDALKANGHTVIPFDSSLFE